MSSCVFCTIWSSSPSSSKLYSYPRVLLLTIINSNSFFRLLLRAINQMIFLTPKPQFIPPSPQHRPYIGSIFIPNIICILLHLFCARPEAGEAMRGYLHGGVIIDLIGQKGPSSKFQLIGLDLLVLGLQCFMLAVHVEKERLGSVLKAFTMPTPSTGAEATVAESQTLDAEERGVIRETTASSEVEEGIELQPLRTPTTQAESSTSAALSPEHERLLSEPAPHSSEEEEETEIEAVEIFWSGTAIIADFHILENLRRQWHDYGNATESALQTMGFSAEFAAVTANRRINAASARFQRSVDG